MAQELTTFDEELEKLAQQHAGLGASDREEDQITAWVKVLHQLSPELNSREPVYVEEAKPGDIWIAAKELLIPGQQGFHFQQVGYHYCWVEWPGQPGGGGRPVARHAQRPNSGVSNGPGRVDLPNGHQVIETRYHMGFLYYNKHMPFPATISYSSTGAQVSSNWTNRQWGKRNKDGTLAPTCKYIWHLATIERSNERGRWFLLVPTKDQETVATPEQFKAGLDLAQKVQQQQVRLGTENAMDDSIPF